MPAPAATSSRPAWPELRESPPVRFARRRARTRTRRRRAPARRPPTQPLGGRALGGSTARCCGDGLRRRDAPHNAMVQRVSKRSSPRSAPTARRARARAGGGGGRRARGEQVGPTRRRRVQRGDGEHDAVCRVCRRPPRPRWPPRRPPRATPRRATAEGLRIERWYGVPYATRTLTPTSPRWAAADGSGAAAALRARARRARPAAADADADAAAPPPLLRVPAKNEYIVDDAPCASAARRPRPPRRAAERRAAPEARSAALGAPPARLRPRRARRARRSAARGTRRTRRSPGPRGRVLAAFPEPALAASPILAALLCEVVDAAPQQPLYDARCAGFGYAFARRRRRARRGVGLLQPRAAGRLLVAVLRRALAADPGGGTRTACLSRASACCARGNSRLRRPDEHAARCLARAAEPSRGSIDARLAVAEARRPQLAERTRALGAAAPRARRCSRTATRRARRARARRRRRCAARARRRSRRRGARRRRRDDDARRRRRPPCRPRRTPWRRARRAAGGARGHARSTPNADDVNAAVGSSPADRPDPSPAHARAPRLLTQLLKERASRSCARASSSAPSLGPPPLRRAGSCVEGISVRVVSKTTGPTPVRAHDVPRELPRRAARDAPPPPPPRRPRRPPRRHEGAAATRRRAGRRAIGAAIAPRRAELDDGDAAGRGALATRLREPPKTLGAETSRLPMRSRARGSSGGGSRTRPRRRSARRRPARARAPRPRATRATGRPRRAARDVRRARPTRRAAAGPRCSRTPAGQPARPAATRAAPRGLRPDRRRRDRARGGRHRRVRRRSRSGRRAPLPTTAMRTPPESDRRAFFAL